MYCTFKLGGIQHTVSQRKIDHDFLYSISLFKVMTAASSVARMFSLLVNKNLLTNLSTNSIQGTLLLCPRVSYRLQNSPYFCVFKYARAVKQKVLTRLKTESETGERRFFSLASHARRACEDRALRARKTLTPRFTDFFTDSEKKTDCFTVEVSYE